jgi:hypothetical protein
MRSLESSNLIAAGYPEKEMRAIAVTDENALIQLKLMEDLDELDQISCWNPDVKPFECLSENSYSRFVTYDKERHEKVRGLRYESLDWLERADTWQLSFFGFKSSERNWIREYDDEWV